MKTAKNKSVAKKQIYMWDILLALIAIVAAVVSIILYKLYGTNTYCLKYSNEIFVALGVGIALLIAGIALRFISFKWSADVIKVLKAAAYLLFLYATMQFVSTQTLFYGAWFMKIDPQYPPLIPGFLATISVMGATVLIALIATCLNGRKKKEIA